MSDIVDALPYIDNEFNNPQVRAFVAQLIEDEMKRYKPTKNYLETLPGLPKLDLHKFETDFLKKEFDRLSLGKPMEQLNMKRYELPSPSTGKLNDVWAWQECLENSYTQLEHQAIRIENLELMNQFGPEAWKQYISLLTKQLERVKAHLDNIRKQIQDINLNRKTNQVEAGEKMKILEERWVASVFKNYELERAIIQLEEEQKKQEQTATETN